MAAFQTFMKELVETDGAPGFEHEVAKVMARYLKGVGTISNDKLGSFICEKKGSSAKPRVMLAGHLDEVGFMVKSVTKEGFVKFLPLGGWWGHVVLGAAPAHSRRARATVLGVVGSKPPHELRDEDRKKVLEIKDHVHRCGRDARLGREEEARHPPRRSDPADLGLHADGESEPAAGEGLGQPHGLRARRRDRAAPPRRVAPQHPARGGHGAGGSGPARRADVGVQGRARRGVRARCWHRARHARHRRREKCSAAAR